MFSTKRAMMILASMGAAGAALMSTPTSGAQADCPAPEFMARADVRGLGLAEVDRDGVDVSVYGFAEYPGECVTEETIFEAASLTKPVVAYLTLRLVDQGRLGLDDALVERLPSLPLPADDPRSARVTMRMALAHSTGLRGSDDGELSFIAAPGETFRYYPAGYRLVQRVVEHVEGATLEELAQREVFGPLGMTNSSLVFRVDLLDRIATRHRMLGDPFQRRRDPARPANAAASLITTPGDYGRFLRAMLTGEGLSPGSLNAMLTPNVTVPDTEGSVAWGVGWGLEPTSGTFFHWGDDGSTKCFTMGSREAGRAFVYLTNSYYGMAIAGEIAAQQLPGEHPSIGWLGYGAWDSPDRLARRDVVRDFVEGSADLGMQTLERYERDYPDLDMDGVAGFAVWILGGRGKHDGRARLLAWRIERQPDNVDLYLDRVQSLREIGDDDVALETLSIAMDRAGEARSESIANRISWIQDEIIAGRADERGTPPDPAALAGTYGERRVRVEEGRLVYQRGDRPRHTIRWMHGTTYAFEALDWFRVRFVLEDGRAVKLIALYADGRSDESPRSGP
jgi:CubicO group peptidase (beta-lactamase class C family)